MRSPGTNRFRSLDTSFVSSFIRKPSYPTTWIVIKVITLVSSWSVVAKEMETVRADPYSVPGEADDVSIPVFSRNKRQKRSRQVGDRDNSVSSIIAILISIERLACFGGRTSAFQFRSRTTSLLQPTYSFTSGMFQLRSSSGLYMPPSFGHISIFWELGVAAYTQPRRL